MVVSTHSRAGGRPKPRRRARAPRVREAAIHMAVVRHLELRARTDVFWAHVPNGEYRARVTAAILKGMGVRRGVPDLMLVRGGLAHFLELKREGGALSDDQAAMHGLLRNAGAKIATAYGIDQALAILEGWGCLR